MTNAGNGSVRAGNVMSGANVTFHVTSVKNTPIFISYSRAKRGLLKWTNVGTNFWYVSGYGNQLSMPLGGLSYTYLDSHQPRNISVILFLLFWVFF